MLSLSILKFCFKKGWITVVLYYASSVTERRGAGGGTSKLKSNFKLLHRYDIHFMAIILMFDSRTEQWTRRKDDIDKRLPAGSIKSQDSRCWPSNSHLQSSFCRSAWRHTHLTFILILQKHRFVAHRDNAMRRSLVLDIRVHALRMTLYKRSHVVRIVLMLLCPILLLIMQLRTHYTKYWTSEKGHWILTNSPVTLNITLALSPLSS